jgi:RHS repeat-associated protein
MGPWDWSLYDADGNRYLTSRYVYEEQWTMQAFSYHRADNQLRVVDRRVCDGNGPCKAPRDTRSALASGFEEYRYDALGRRVLVRTRRDSTCAGGPTDRKYDCQSTIQRTVWDGDQVLYELRMPGADTTSLASMERDTVSLNVQLAPYGRVAYTNGLGLDKPLDIIRLGYGVGVDTVPTAFRLITLIPHWNWRGLGDMGTTPQGILDSQTCQPNSFGGQTCLSIAWPAANATAFMIVPPAIPKNWFGGLIQENQDGSGLLYKRNRYYDPTAGRFTQEDPIGLAGGMNLYGYANGDPINLSDPFGLCPPKTREEVFLCVGQLLAPAQKPLEIAGTIVVGLPLTAEAGVAGAVGLSTREATAGEQLLTRIGTKLGNQLSHLDRGHLSIASRELNGLVSGWDHVTEVREAMAGVSQTIDKLKRLLANPSIESDVRAAAERLLSRASRTLDAAENALRR